MPPPSSPAPRWRRDHRSGPAAARRRICARRPRLEGIRARSSADRRGHLSWAMADIGPAQCLHLPGRAIPDDTLPPMMPLPRPDRRRPRLADQFRALGGSRKPATDASSGHFTASTEFRVPGEKDAFMGLFAVPHDGLHVLSGFSTSIQGELLVSTFTGAMHHTATPCARPYPARHLRQWHVGSDVNGIGAQSSALDPHQVLGQLAARGESTTTDVLSRSGTSGRPRSTSRELREQACEIVPLLPADAATGEEIIVEKEADRYAQWSVRGRPCLWFANRHVQRDRRRARRAGPRRRELGDRDVPLGSAGNRVRRCCTGPFLRHGGRRLRRRCRARAVADGTAKAGAPRSS